MAEILKPNMNTMWAEDGAIINPTAEKIKQGWTVEIPPHQTENFVQYRQDSAIKYLFQRGVAEWDSATEYFSNRSIVMGRDGNLYKSLSNNIGIDPTTDTGQNWEDMLGNIAPVGSVSAFVGNVAPRGYLLCNGDAVSRAVYPRLFSLIGTAYGTGDGSSTFNLPDYRGEFLRGADLGRGVEAGRTVGSRKMDTYKSHTHSASSTASGSHTHTGSLSTAGDHTHSGVAASGGVHTHTAASSASGSHTHTGSSGASGAHTHTGSTGSSGVHNHGVSVSSAGAHTHPVSVNSAGDHTHTLSVDSGGVHTHGATTGPSGEHTHLAHAATNWHVSGQVGHFNDWGQPNGSTWSNLLPSGIHTHSVSVSSSGNHTHTGTANTGGAHTHTGTATNAGGHTHTASSENSGAHTHDLTTVSAGSHSHTLTIDNDGNHSHTVSVNSDGSHTHSISINSVAGHTHDLSVVSSGSHDHSISVSASGDSETAPRNVAVNYIIKY